MGSGFSAVHQKELRASGIATGMCHGQNTQIMGVIFSVEFAVNGISWSTASPAVWAAALGNKSGDYTMKRQSVIKAFFGQFDKVRDSLRGVFFEELNGHVPFVCGYFCLHGFAVFALGSASRKSDWVWVEL
jgi:hypothetical protein